MGGCKATPCEHFAVVCVDAPANARGLPHFFGARNISGWRYGLQPAMAKPRNYAREYREYHGMPAQIRNRSTRNKARRMLGLRRGDPREVDHRIALKRNPRNPNARDNLRVVSRATNRRKGSKRC